MHDSEPGPQRSEQEPGAVRAAEPPEPEGGTGFAALRDDLTALVDDARTYAEAEIAFQKTRAGLAGKRAARALGALVLAVVLLHIALIALAVGALIALAPVVTIWGAIALVVGAVLLAAGALVRVALGDRRMLTAMFGRSEDGA